MCPNIADNVLPPEARSGRAAHVGPIARGEHARQRVLRAALDILSGEGLAGFTIDAVARRAGASKATVYRRWSSRAVLLVDAMDVAFEPFPTPSSGDLRTDLLQLVSDGLRLFSSQPFPRLLAAVIDFAEREPSLPGLHKALTQHRREPVRQALVAARDLGEFPASVDLELAIDLLAGPAFYRRFIAHQGFPDGYAERLVDCVLCALGHVPRTRGEGRATRSHRAGHSGPMGGHQ